MKNRPKTFQFMVRIHKLMTAQKRAGRKLVELKDGPYTTRIFPMIGVGKDRDPLMVDLRKIKCSSAFGPTQLYIQQFWWNGHRGNYIWDKIHSLARNGCKVHVIFGAVDSGLLRRMKAARSNNFEIWDSRWDSDDPDGCVNTRTHMKNIAIRGTYGKNHRYAGVWTGTANWATGSLTKGDENTLNIRSASMYRQYVERWRVVKSHSSPHVDPRLPGPADLLRGRLSLPRDSRRRALPRRARARAVPRRRRRAGHRAGRRPPSRGAGRRPAVGARRRRPRAAPCSSPRHPRMTSRSSGASPTRLAVSARSSSRARSATGGAGSPASTQSSAPPAPVPAATRS